VQPPVQAAAPLEATELAERLDQLSLILKEGAEQLDRRTAGATERLLRRAGQRLRLSGTHTVVALAGGTGSGKSTLFNALSGLDLSGVGVRRPTTSAPYACVWGPDPATELLDWLEVPTERRILRESELDADSEAALHGLVLLDLPDHDSIEVSHRLEVDRLVDLVDVLVWVLDPQKYADTAVHEFYLKRLKAYSDIMLIALNQADRLDPGQAQSCLADLRRMLTDDGLGSIRTMLTSTRTGIGVPDLRAVLTTAVASRRATARRIRADLSSLAPRLVRTALPDVDLRRVQAQEEEAVAELADLAGVERIAVAATADYRTLGLRRVGWPPVAWRHRRERGVPPLAVSRADVGKVATTVALNATAELVGPWPSRLERRADAVTGSLADGLDGVIHAAVQQPVAKPPWWRIATIVQWLLLGFAVAGVAWAGRAFLAGGRQWPLSMTGLGGLVVTGVALSLGLALAGIFGRSVVKGADRWQAAVEGRLRPEVAIVAGERLFSQLTADLATYNSVQEALNSFAPRAEVEPPTAETPKREAPAADAPGADPVGNGRVAAALPRGETAKLP